MIALNAVREMFLFLLQHRWTKSTFEIQVTRPNKTLSCRQQDAQYIQRVIVLRSS